MSIAAQGIICEQSGNFKNVAKIFEITLAEFDLLLRCRRDDIALYGLNLCHTNKAERESLASLRDRGFVWQASPLSGTGKWELTEWGITVVDTAPLVAHCTFRRRAKGEVIVFPGSTGKTSA